MADINVTDSTGRVLTIREMDPADQLDLFEACAQNSTNQAWVGMALLVCSVRGIDGLPWPMPTKPHQVKTLARKLGREGIDAVAKVLRGDEEAPKVAIDEVQAVAKN